MSHRCTDVTLVCMQTRLNVLKLLRDKQHRKQLERERLVQLQEDALIISFFTVMPPDRVGDNNNKKKEANRDGECRGCGW